jgi:uncharacterized protein
MSRLVILGAAGSLGGQVLRQAVAAGHAVTAVVRSPSRLDPELAARVTVQAADLAARVPLEAIEGCDAVVNCAGHVGTGEAFVQLFDALVSALDSLAAERRPVCWFLAGAALLDLDPSGRRGVDLPKLKSTYWPHRVNYERLLRSRLDWRLLCPGPMVHEPAVGLERLRISLDALPVRLSPIVRALPGALGVAVFASRIPEMIIPYADAAALMLANLDRGNATSRHRVGVALPHGMRGRKPQWAAKAESKTR